MLLALIANFPDSQANDAEVKVCYFCVCPEVVPRRSPANLMGLWMNTYALFGKFSVVHSEWFFFFSKQETGMEASKKHY